MKEDYPRNLVELEARFSTEEACREYLLKLRWPEGFVCPRCGIQSSWASKRNLLLCADCGYQASVTAGTIFQDTRKPLTLWFRAAWWVTTQKGGASALELQRVLGLGSYVTAWTWLHKFRRAMVRPGRNRLVGRVEVDETYVGGVEEGVRGREMVGKALRGGWARYGSHPAPSDRGCLSGELGSLCRRSYPTWQPRAQRLGRLCGIEQRIPP